MSRQVVVTGLGPVTGIGVGAHAFHQGQLACASGIRTITRFDIGAWDLPVSIAGEVDVPPDRQLSRRQIATTDRCTQLALVAARLAVEDAQLPLGRLDLARVGVVIGTGIGGVQTWEEGLRPLDGGAASSVTPRAIPKAMCNAPAAVVAIEYGFAGPLCAPTVACASGAEALVQAYQMIACGEADVVLAGGAEAPVSPSMIAGFSVMRALSRRNDDPAGASRPFSIDRDGFVLAEGAAVLVLESAEHAARRGAAVLAVFAGYGRAGDAYHVTAPEPDGRGAGRAIVAALRHAQIAPDDLCYVNAHGTATVFNDLAEVNALRWSLGEAAERIPVSSTKSQLGHSLGAAGAIEAVATVQAITTAVIPPTLNLAEPDPALGLDFVAGTPREVKVAAALSSSFAFGGHNVVLAFTRW